MRGAVVRQQRLDVTVRRGEQGIGIEVDEANCIVRVVPGSTADIDHQLHAGDVIDAVNGRRLKGRLLGRALARCPEATELIFTVLREVWDACEWDADGGTGTDVAGKAPIASAAARLAARPAAASAAASTVAASDVAADGASDVQARAPPGGFELPFALGTPVTAPDDNESSPALGINALKSWTISWAIFQQKQQEQLRRQQQQQQQHAALLLQAAGGATHAHDTSSPLASPLLSQPSPPSSEPSSPAPLRQSPLTSNETVRRRRMGEAIEDRISTLHLDSFQWIPHRADARADERAPGLPCLKAVELIDMHQPVPTASEGVQEEEGKADALVDRADATNILGGGSDESDNVAEVAAVGPEEVLFSASMLPTASPLHGPAPAATSASLPAALPATLPAWLCLEYQHVRQQTLSLSRAPAALEAALGCVSSPPMPAATTPAVVSTLRKVISPRKLGRIAAAPAAATDTDAAVAAHTASVTPTVAPPARKPPAVAPTLPPAHRAPPRPPSYLSTIRMEELLRTAMAAAVDDPTHEHAFNEMLMRYQCHPGVRRRYREREAQERRMHEMSSRACYWAERKRLPAAALHPLASLDELVAAGCSWELAAELLKYPILKLLPLGREELLALPIHDLLRHNLDRRMSEQQARAVYFFLIDRFDSPAAAVSSDVPRRAATGAARQREEWLETQRRLFGEMEDRGFRPPPLPLRRPQTQPPPPMIVPTLARELSPRPPPPAKPPAKPPVLPSPSPLPAQLGVVTDGSASKHEALLSHKLGTLCTTSAAANGGGRREYSSPSPPSSLAATEPPFSRPAPASTMPAPMSRPAPTSTMSAPMSRPAPASTMPAPPSAFDASTLGAMEHAASTEAASTQAAPSPTLRRDLDGQRLLHEGEAPLHTGWRAVSEAAAVAGFGESSPNDGESTTLLELIGQGTYGAVFRGKRTTARHDAGAEPAQEEEMVAVKVLALNLETASHIRHEIDLMKRCMHPNIVAYRDAFHRSMHGAPTLWVVMEMAEYGSTLDVMRKRAAPLPEAAIGWVCAGVLAGLHYMHTIARAIHRDIKAANVLVMRDAVVKLGDLGVAAQLQRTMSRRGTMIGTPHWMAPEAFTGQNADGEETEYDCRVDVWSLGVTAIELAEKQPPHSQKRSIFQVMVHIANAPPPELAPTTDASPVFRAFVAAALIKQPTDRPTAAELGKHHFIVGAMSDALAAVVSELPTAMPTRGQEQPLEGTLPAQL